MDTLTYLDGFAAGLYLHHIIYKFLKTGAGHMLQTTLSVPLDVRPESASRLAALIEQVKLREDKGRPEFAENFGRLLQDIPVLHFMSMSVFHSTSYDPIFIIEANFDGPPAVFWRQFEAMLGDVVRDMLRCCKKPLDRWATLYDAVTASGSQVALAPYLEARTQKPSVFHHGNRGLSRERVLSEAKLFVTLRDELDQPTQPYRGANAATVHQRLRDRMLAAYPWLSTPAPVRISPFEWFWDRLRFVVFLVITLFVLTLPGVILALLVPVFADLAVVTFLAILILASIFALRKPLPGTEVTTQFNLPLLLWKASPYIVGYVLAATVVLFPLDLATSWALSKFGVAPPELSMAAFWSVARHISLGLYSLIVVLPLIVLWLRYLETRDSSQDAPVISEALLEEMARKEDWVAQNHMGSIVLIKPGVLRTIIIRAGHRGLGLLLRVTATDGYLGSMRTVHFAHWAFLNNGSRLLFFSNFDQSWGAYLDDFIEKAHVGLTLAWGDGVGFPATRFLIFDGASHGRQFKNWALASRAVSRFWVSAYPDLTVNQIERNNRIANGLREQSLTEERAAAWMTDL